MSAPDWISGLVKELQHPRPAFAVFTTCGVCLVLTGPTAAWVGATWLAEARPWLLVGLLVSGGLLFWDTCRAIGARLGAGSARRAAIKELKDLPERERRQVALWLREGYRSGRLSEDSTGEALAARGIFQRGEKSGRPGDDMRHYSIPSFIWKHLMEHPEVVGEPERPKEKK